MIGREDRSPSVKSAKKDINAGIAQLDEPEREKGPGDLFPGECETGSRGGRW